MQLAYQQAQKAIDANEVPIGAVVVDEAGEVISASHNMCETNNDSTAHAELLAIRKATEKLQTKNLSNCSIYVTLEPCPMCAQAISFARIKTLTYGAQDAKGGGVENGAKIFDATSCHHKPEVISGIMEDECGEILKYFFASKR